MFRKVEFQPFDMIHDKRRVFLLNDLLEQWKTGGPYMFWPLKAQDSRSFIHQTRNKITLW